MAGTGGQVIVQIEQRFARNGFIRLSEATRKKLSRDDDYLVVQVLPLDKTGTCEDSSACVRIVSVESTAHQESEQVGLLHPAWISALALSPGSEVILRPIAVSLRPLEQVWLRPSTEEDWEILELNASQIRSSLLDQITAVTNGSSLVIFCSGNFTVAVEVVKLVPNVALGRLVNHTQALIEPKERSNMLVPSLPSAIDRDPQAQALPQLVRLAPFPEVLKSGFEGKASHAFCAIMVPYGAVERGKLVAEWDNLFVELVVVSRKGQEDPESACVMKCHSVRDDNNSSNNAHFFVSDEVMSALSVSIGTRVALRRISSEKELAREHKLMVRSSLQQEDGFEALASMLNCSCDSYPVLVPRNLPIRVLSAPENATEIQCANGNFVLDQPVCETNLFQWVHNQSLTEPDQDFINERVSLSGCDSVHESIKLSFQSAKYNRATVEHVLLVGESGLGKSTAVKQISSRLSSYPLFSAAKMLSCKQLIGKKVESVLNEMLEALEECLYRAPCVLVLEDLETLCRQQDESLQNLIEENRLASLSHGVVRLLDKCTSHGIPVLATACNVADLNALLKPGKGNHTFRLISLEFPDKHLRRRLLEQCSLSMRLREFLASSSRFNTLTEGFTPKDIKRLASHLVNHDGSMKDLEDFDFQTSEVKPFSVWNVNLHKSGNRCWKDVGGLGEARKALEETIIWPGKYPRLFAQIPLRRQSGILIFGAPGTGKTLLISAMAKESGLNFITVKGPELLSKYIGSSEANVRDTFERAKNAAPCILFFDEFDSLAPRRGHDNTGVTDRVVNQLLTQLDGVEGGTGNLVFVIAATARPDLIDPALLRPGRLDKKVVCPMPDEKCRLSILQALSRSEDVEQREDALSEAASLSQGFTGADLQAALYTAKLESVKESLKEKTQELVTRSPANARHVVTHKYSAETGTWTSSANAAHTSLPLSHRTRSNSAIISKEALLNAVRGTRPSVSRQELSRLQMIYERFSNSALTTAEHREIAVNQRTTLA